MTLSEAIKLGAMMRPQSFGAFLHDGKSCALGAACEAVGIKVGIRCNYEGMTALSTMFPLIDRLNCVCPEDRCGVSMPLGTMIAHMNDYHRWTREQIADWVATKEPQPEPQAEETTELVTVAQ